MIAEPHQSISWALEAWALRDNYLPERNKHRRGGILDGFTEAAVVVISFELVRGIELELKANLQTHLTRRHGTAWWNALPAPVRKSAEARHRWATLQLGQRRAGAASNIHWLSFGDIVKALHALSLPEWQSCLGSETRRRSAVEQRLYRVKAFRDLELAHPRPRRMTNLQLRVMCTAVKELPEILCPQEWDRLLDLLAAVGQLPKEDQQKLINDIDFEHQRQRLHIRRWLACPRLDPPDKCVHVNRVSGASISWRYRVLKACASNDSGRRVFFSFGERR